MTGTRRCVFLDRDGVLVAARVEHGTPVPMSTGAPVELLPGVVEACDRLVADGWILVVVTNQPDLARGTTTLAEVERINGAVASRLPVTDVLVCPHDDGDGCACRKPKPGMLVDAAARWGIDLTGSAIVGDRWRDIDAGRAAGVTTFFVDHGYGEPLHARPDHVVASLVEAAARLLQRPAVRHG